MLLYGRRAAGDAGGDSDRRPELSPADERHDRDRAQLRNLQAGPSHAGGEVAPDHLCRHGTLGATAGRLRLQQGKAEGMDSRLAMVVIIEMGPCALLFTEQFHCSVEQRRSYSCHLEVNVFNVCMRR